MATDPDGGPAFPRPASYESLRNGAGAPIPQSVPAPSQTGLTIRDYFAGRALTGLLAAGPKVPASDPAKLLHRAYEYADAALIERENS